MSELENGPENALGKAASAYLRSARHQPIDWSEWGAAAFEKAKLENKPVLLDIGAVWCHWCHVMDRESYENPELAALINKLFIAVGGAAIFTSPDGITWTSRVAADTFWQLYGVAYGNNLYVVVDEDGDIASSPATSAVKYVAPKQRLSIHGKTIQIYTLQGKLITQKQIGNESYLDGKSRLYNNLPMGSYVIRIPGNHPFVSKVTKVE